MMMPDTLIEARHLSFRPHGATLLQDVSLTVRKGEIVSLIGPNGAGKTTLLRLLLGTFAPDEGTVTRREGLIIGYVPQQVDINPYLPITVRRFLALAGYAGTEEQRRFLHETRTDTLLDHSLHRLSGGERQRVLLARALIRRPHLLVLDEPVQGVDAPGQTHLYGYLAHLRDSLRCGILLVSHDLHFVMAATDHVVCLNKHVCCSGTAEQVTQDAQFAELFGKEALLPIAAYTHHHDHAHGWTPTVEGKK